MITSIMKTVVVGGGRSSNSESDDNDNDNGVPAQLVDLTGNDDVNEDDDVVEGMANQYFIYK